MSGFNAAVPGFQPFDNALKIAQTADVRADTRDKNMRAAEFLALQEERVRAKQAEFVDQTQSSEMNTEANAAVREEGLHTKAAVQSAKTNIQKSEVQETEFKRSEDFYKLDNIKSQRDWEVARLGMIQDNRSEEYIDSVLGPAAQGYNEAFLAASRARLAETTTSTSARRLQADEIQAKLAVAEMGIKEAYIRASASAKSRGFAGIPFERKDVPIQDAQAFTNAVMNSPADPGRGALFTGRWNEDEISAKAQDTYGVYLDGILGYAAQYNAYIEREMHPPASMKSPAEMSDYFKNKAIISTLGLPTELPSPSYDDDPSVVSPAEKKFAEKFDLRMSNVQSDFYKLWEGKYSHLSRSDFRDLIWRLEHSGE